ncbi:glutamate racemase [Altibacter sp. HG106]|uniref:glutamate racemase n=1 Tax=Altibacter sp. HG106 TaxID=3023937 RepID=UPI002350CAC1|nr:glutamate racemase [Altibacter sp. HG106]MDC7994626.1 glutamate racemase [Altibacter sp. HG106]
MSIQPIGIFDSGVGGVSIWKEIHACLQQENTLYLADSKHAPYGNKSADDIVALSVKNTEYLLSQGCKLIVVACNTATTNAISHLRSNYDIPFIGIEPAIKPAALQTKTKSIGILATKGTLSSALFHQTAEAFTKDISVIEIVGEGLVPLIEAGAMDSEETIELLTTYMKPMLAANIDYLVLGCSHYPFLIPSLKKILPPHVTIIDSGAAVARQTKSILEQYNMLNHTTSAPTLQFFSNGDTRTLTQLLGNIQAEVFIEPLDF